MNKKMIRLLAAVLLFAFLTACATKPETPSQPDPEDTPSAAETAETPSDAGSVFKLEASGVTFELPAETQSMRGVFQPSYGMELAQGSGIYLSGLLYCAFPKEKYRELAEKSGDLTDEERDFVSARMIDFLLVYTADGERSMEELAPELATYGLPTDGCRQIGAAGEYRFYSVVNPLAEILDSEFRFDEGYREEYDRLIALCGDLSWVRCAEPSSDTAEAGALVSFETTDLHGDPVRSRDLFAANTLTMVNLWGTYCGPCINEMPDLEVLNGRLREKNCAIIGVVIDVAGPNDSEMIGTAEEIIADTGVTYQNLLPWNGMNDALPSKFIPTTYFIDAEGRIVGEAVVGANGADEYEAIIDGLLKELQ